MSNSYVSQLSQLSLLVLFSSFANPCFAQSATPREWSDSTGNFRISASLMEVKDGAAFLKNAEGKILKIPVARLSMSDQEFLKGSSNPFEEIRSDAVPMASESSSANAAGAANAGAAGGGSWSSDLKIDWSDVEELDRSSDGEWKLVLPKQNDLGFTPKRAALNKKNTFHEDIRRLEINPLAQRAVVGYTVSFGVPKPQSRLALIDLVSGKAIHTDPVECDMCPLTLLNDGSTALMYGTSDDRKGFETSDQIQLWKVNGKKVVRSAMWIPFPDEAEHFGKTTNGRLIDAIPLPNNKLLLLSANGHLVCIDAVSRKPFWHAKLSGNFAIDASADRSLLAIADGHAILIADPQTGAVKCSTMLQDKPHVAWPKVRWSPSGNRLLVSFTTELRVLDLTNGQWTHRCSFTGAPLAPNSISYPHDDYALLENRMLVHLPTQIKVCEYRDASRITNVGGTSFIAMQSADMGFVVPSTIPHPAAEKILAQAEKDPSVFLIHPGVQVSIDAGGAGQHAGQVAKSLESAAKNAGYQVVANSPISIVASISGPKQEAVSYIASGAYIANVFQSSVRLTWQGKDLWSTGGNNIPGFLQTARGESIQEKLDELGKTPNLSVFEHAQFPKMLQKPSEAAGNNAQKSEALLVSKFTMQGLVDSK